jgi:hypothetical protein
MRPREARNPAVKKATGANARATGEVLTAEQSCNNDKGDVENTILGSPCRIKKATVQQREAPFKTPQMDAPVQYTVLAEIPATMLYPGAKAGRMTGFVNPLMSVIGDVLPIALTQVQSAYQVTFAQINILLAGAQL